MIVVRERVSSWRFYDHFRSDTDAPARQPQIGTHTPVLSDNGADFAAALQTIREIGDAKALDDAIDDAFPGASIEIIQSEGRFEVAMRQKGLLRQLKASELSDGTLRYLLLITALLTPRPPELLVLNEPETSLHPDLVPALSRLIQAAALTSQVIVVTHNHVLISALRQDADAQIIHLEKSLGETQISGLRPLDQPRWEWPSRSSC
jgi:predicted ATPase